MPSTLGREEPMAPEFLSPVRKAVSRGMKNASNPRLEITGISFAIVKVYQFVSRYLFCAKSGLFGVCMLGGPNTKGSTFLFRRSLLASGLVGDELHRIWMGIPGL